MTRVTDRATGAVAISTTINPKCAWELEQVVIHLSAAGGAGNLTATMDAVTGAVYDAVVFSKDMTSITDWVYRPDDPLFFDSGDAVIFAWTNALGRTYSLAITYRLLGTG